MFDLKVLEKGIPDDAYKPLTGDDKDVARDLKRRNKQEAKGQETLGILGSEDLAAAEAGIARAARELEVFEDDSPAAVHEKERRYHQFRELHADFRRLREACDLWTAAFFARLEKSKPGEPERVPTTDHVLRALRNQPGTQGVAKSAQELAQDHSFFHWPVEFAEVFAAGGFDVALGNPPWDVSQLSEEEFFASRDVEVARLAGAERKAAIKRLETTKPRLWDEYLDAKRSFEAINGFYRASGRFKRTAIGKINSYAIFAETFAGLPNGVGRAGLIVPTGIATDDNTKMLFDSLTSERRLVSLVDFENREAVFPGIHRSYKFCLLTLGSGLRATTFAFFATRTEHLADDRRWFALSPDEIALINPNTRTCPVFRSQADAELTKKIYRRVPVLIDEARGETGNPWGMTFRQGLFNMTSDSELFRTYAQLRDAGGRLDGMIWMLPSGERWLPLYEAKMIQQFDHRRGSYVSRGGERGNRVLPDVSDGEHSDPWFLAQPFYWTQEREVGERIAAMGQQRFLMAFRESTTSVTTRTTVSAAIPLAGVGHTLTLYFVLADINLKCALLANINSLCLDYVSRIKLSYLHLTQFIFKQLPLLSPSNYASEDLDFVASRVLELTYTAWDMQPFAQDLGYEGEPFRWDPERRAVLRAELDAYYAYLYGLSKEELRYILDPKEVMGEDYPSETFRVLKDNENRKYGEYRTQRLVLEAYDRFAQDGTFDPARLEDPEYFPIVREALKVSKAREQELEKTLEELVARTDESPLPTLFVEGETDKLIVEGAWQALFPGEPLPVSVLPAGGTTQMKSLATPGKAMRELLGDRLVMALADNDAEGRELWNEGNLHKGGVWKPQTNGVHWCLLKPSDEFTAVMERFQVPRSHWPFTLENAFSAALRREVMADGAYAISDKVQSDLIRDPEVAQRIFAALRGLDESDDAYLYLMAPTPEAKDAFAAWVTGPACLTPDNFAAFEIVLSRLKDLLARHRARAGGPQPQRQTA